MRVKDLTQPRLAAGDDPARALAFDVMARSSAG